MPNTYTELLKTTVGTATSSVTLDLTGISGYTDLVMIISQLGTASGAEVYMQLNGDTASNYSYTQLYGNGSSASSIRQSSQTFLKLFANEASSTTAPSTYIVNLQNYSNTTTFKTILFRSNGGGTPAVAAAVGLWRKTPEAITSLTIYTPVSTFAVGSTFSLYGIANADQGAAKATGGIITEDSQYWYHTFGASGAFIPKQSLTCDVLVVAGGGGGSIGGGGAGGLLEYSAQSLTAINHTITVGAGGTALVNNVNSGSKGTNSQFASLTASVGGGSGQINDGAGADQSGGGSGGGGGGSSGGTTTGGAGTTGQGNAGGGNGGSGLTGVPAGGGGGKGAVGGTGSSNQGGNGGIGGTSALINAIGIATGAGQLSGGNYYFAGGGGGGGNGVTNFGTGGLGGGANASNVPVANARANTGGGGGGYNGGLNQGSNGGSGIVVVRYLKA